MNFHRNHFDLIRLFAATQVAIVHGLHHFVLEDWWTLSIALRLFPGVPIFFVMSGFLVSASLERSSSIRSYATKRALRIFPALWFALLLSVVAVYLVDGIDTSAASLSVWLAAQASFLQFYNPDFLSGFGIGVLNGSLWTVSVEMQFYAFLPVLYVLLRYLRWKPVPLCGILASMLLARQLNIEWLSASDELPAKLYGVSLLPHLYMFMLGIVIQRRFDVLVPFLSRHAIALLACYLVLALVLHRLGFQTYGHTVNPVSATLLGLVVIGVGYWRASDGSILGDVDISYGTYIYHMPVVNLMLELGAGDTVGSVLAMLLITFALATVSWHLVERPALNFRKAAAGRRTGLDGKT